MEKVLGVGVRRLQKFTREVQRGLAREVRLIFVLESKLGPISKMRPALPVLTLRPLESNPTSDVIKSCVLSYVRGLGDGELKRFVTISDLIIQDKSHILPQ